MGFLRVCDCVVIFTQQNHGRLSHCCCSFLHHCLGVVKRSFHSWRVQEVANFVIFRRVWLAFREGIIRRRVAKALVVNTWGIMLDNLFFSCFLLFSVGLVLITGH